MTALTRPTCPALDEILGRQFPVLDHGFVRVVDYMGDDDAIVQAARVSYGAGTKTLNDDRGLIRYLMSHRHSTPFEMCEIKLHVKLPIFIARQWIRHRTASVNEYSARYSILDREFYVPDVEQVCGQSSSNKQGRGVTLTPEHAKRVSDLLRRDADRCFDSYDYLINDDGHGDPLDPTAPQVARELARIGLTLNTYTQWYWKIDLHNLLGFLALRMDAHAQWEFRQYAQQIGEIVKLWCPLAWEAFGDYRLGAVTLSRMEVDALALAFPKHLVSSASVCLRSFGASEREVRDFERKIGAHGLNTRQAAAVLGITNPATIANWLHGGHFPGATRDATGEMRFDKAKLHEVAAHFSRLRAKNEARDLSFDADADYPEPPLFGASGAGVGESGNDQEGS